MIVHVQALHFDADTRLLHFIQEKVDKLIHFYDHIIGGEVVLRLDKATNMKNKIAVFLMVMSGLAWLVSGCSSTNTLAMMICVNTAPKAVSRRAAGKSI